MALHNIKTKALEKECHEEGQKKNAMEKERPIKRGWENEISCNKGWKIIICGKRCEIPSNNLGGKSHFEMFVDSSVIFFGLGFYIMKTHYWLWFFVTFEINFDKLWKPIIILFDYRF